MAGSPGTKESAKESEEEKDLEDDEAQHPNIQSANKKLEDAHQGELRAADMSWFVRHRQSLGNMRCIWKYFALSAALSIVASLFVECLLYIL